MERSREGQRNDEEEQDKLVNEKYPRKIEGHRTA